MRYDEDDGGVGSTSARGRGGRGGRARGRGRGGLARGGLTRGGGRGGAPRGGARGARPGDRKWRRGNSLIEVYPTDEDVPPDLRVRLEALIRDRVARQRIARDKVLRKERERRERSRSERGIRDGDSDGEDETLPAYQEFCRFSQNEEATKF